MLKNIHKITFIYSAISVYHKKDIDEKKPIIKFLKCELFFYNHLIKVKKIIKKAEV